MKKKFFLCTAILLFICFALMAQNVPVEIVTAFKKGNSVGLKPFLGERVELIIQNKTNSYTAQVAENSLNGFFSNNKVNDFTVNHQGNRDDSSFVIGTLITQNGSYRVTCFLLREQGEYFIHQIRIDKIND